MPMPIRYRRTLHQPDIAELCERLSEGTGHAMVRLESGGHFYPVRRRGKVYYASGKFWTWLAGTDLALALCAGDVREVKTAYLWHSVFFPSDKVGKILSVSSACDRDGMSGHKSVWRAMYSALVGQFAGRRKKWVDVADRPGFGRWASWVGMDADTGEEVQYRSIAGRQQKLVERSDTSAAVPLLYACVTAQVRHMIRDLAEMAGLDSVVCLHADSLWLTTAGWQTLQRRCSEMGLPPDNLTCKAVYDRGWFSGRTLCVLERNGKRILKAPGVGDGAVLDAAGRYQSLRSLSWSETGSLGSEKGLKRRKVVYPGASIVKKYGQPATALPIGKPMDEPLMPEELLQRLHSARRLESD